MQTGSAFCEIRVSWLLVVNSTPLREPQLLLPAILKHHGYQTAISGKLHFIPNDLDYGFDYFWSFAHEGPGTLPTWPQLLVLHPAGHEETHGPV